MESWKAENMCTHCLALDENLLLRGELELYKVGNGAALKSFMKYSDSAIAVVEEVMASVCSMDLENRRQDSQDWIRRWCNNGVTEQ